MTANLFAFVQHRNLVFSAKENVQYMPELSRFFGIIIRMYMEVGTQHNKPHFHAYYQDWVAIYGIEPVELISGSLPIRQSRFAEAWAELHSDELKTDWNLLQSGQIPLPIDPLQ